MRVPTCRTRRRRPFPGGEDFPPLSESATTQEISARLSLNLLSPVKGERRRGGAGIYFLIAMALSLLSCGAATFAENYASSPAARGWRTHGDSSLFAWNSTNQSLEVTWDSSRPNSYFYRPLGTILGKQDDFSFQFDLRLHSVQAGVNASKPSTFQITVGLLRLASATNASFNRGTGQNSPHLVEWDYFPAADIIEATVSPVMVSSNSQFIPGFNFPLTMPLNDLFHIALAYTASNRTLATTMTRSGVAFGPIQKVALPGTFTDFRVDAVSISSYNDSGDAYGSVLARGTIDNLTVTTPGPPVANLTARVTSGLYRIQFTGRTNWSYALERSADLRNFTVVQSLNFPATTNLTLEDAMAPCTNRFYRIRADRP